MNIKQAIKQLIDKKDLKQNQMQLVMTDIMSGKCSDAQIGGFLVALASKGETVDEITAAADVMRQLLVNLTLKSDKPLVDTCGTGGDGLNTVNVSTAAALVVASCGIMVAKHGNRSVSSQSGSADLLELAGVKIDADLNTVRACIEQNNIGFMFAPLYHPAMKHAITARRDMAIKTIFNILGPLTNPAGAKHQVIGVFDKKLSMTMVSVLKKLGSTHVMCVHAQDGLDEISISAPTDIVELKNGVISEYQIKPQDFAMKTQTIETIQCLDSKQSLAMITDALNGKKGAVQDIIALNAGAAIYVADVVPSLKAGVEKAMTILANGSAHKTLEKFISISQQ